MKVHKEISNIEIKNPVVTIGMFDGVHCGHKEIINTLTTKANQIGGETVLVSFWPHPRMIFEGNNSLRLLNTMDEKVQLLEQAGINHFVIIPFNRKFANLSYKTFVKEYLYAALNTKELIIGYDHQFGKNREGNFQKLVEMSEKFNFNVNKLDAQIVENENVSSSIARKALQEGHILKANKYLGYTYNFSGYIVEGNKKGREIGYPTANIVIREPYKLIPGKGVYAVKAKLLNKELNGMMNIGYRPTIIEDNKQKTIEVHLFHFNEDIYGRKITNEVYDKIRDEKKFNSLETLKKQLHQDEITTKKILN